MAKLALEPDFAHIDVCGASVTAVRTPHMSRKVTVYNLEVNGPPEFFANNILVHNSVSGIPIVKLLGIQPAGLNASSEGELRTFYDWILAMQEKMIRPNLTVIIDFAMLNLWGKVDKEITFKFIPLWALDEKGLADVRASEAETDVKLIEAGVVSPLESRKRLAADPDSPYASIDVEDVPDLREEEEAGFEPHAGAAKLAEGAGEEEGEIDVPNRGAAGEDFNGGPPHEQGDGLGGEHEADDSEPFETGELRPDYVEGKNPLADGATRRDAQPDHPGRGSPKNRELAAKALRRQQAGELDPDYLEGKDALGQSNPLLGKNPLAGKNRLKQSTLLRERAADRNNANPDHDPRGMVHDSEFRESDHPRGQPGNAGQFGPGGGGEEQSEESEEPEPEMLSKAKSIAKEQGFDPNKISLSDEIKPFTVNGVNYVAGGTAHLKEGTENLYPNAIPKDASIVGLVTHEVMHQKFQSVLDVERAEREQLNKEAGPEPDPNGKYYWQKHGGIDGIMTPDGKLREPYDKKYPIYQKMQELYYGPDLRKFSESDGVSDYSHDYRKDWKAQKISTELAMHETLAEIARIKKETGKFPSHMGQHMLSYREGGVEGKKPTKQEITENEKLWRNLYQGIEAIYKGLR